MSSATWDRIADLQREAAIAGDRATHKACAKALAQSVRQYPRRFKAFRLVQGILAAAEAMEEDRNA